ncbi:capsular biosynthesis protein [Neobacillus piezotolerans]|uniref:non-specific protein-tyrosine kinase n=1 Tax=Neobacillus piezotolerans TaxID=2259171 RepID=A0A3D8GNJ3_9BACI|nr:CpsD/CapB family tyrosine-protein kinase [Neobacillus piezotolerans]RDU36043.1 capsular biosynthesis protein [Neobacillus piezotolerans]
MTYRRIHHWNNKQKNLLSNLNPKSEIAEQYRTVRTNIQFAAVDKKIQIIIITSASPSEGKSMSAVNLAVVYAQQGKNVLLADGDMRKPTVHYTFSLENHKGLSTTLVGNTELEETILPSGIENLDVLVSGPIPPNPSELLASHKMLEFLEAARRVYDIVIVDTPPLLAVTDPQILVSLGDGTVLVIRSKKTEIEDARKAIQMIHSANGKLLGTILNDAQIIEGHYYYT